VTDLSSRWNAAAGIVAEHRDLLDARPGTDAAEQVARTRSWAEALLSLSDDHVARHEDEGLAAAWPHEAPAGLRALVAACRAACNLGPLQAFGSSGAVGRRHEKPRKRAQIDAFARLIGPLAERATRVIDVGCGHGHLARTLAARIGRPVLGLERDLAIADRARMLAGRPDVVFDVTDVIRDGLAVGPTDCVVGLHACGELGDAIVTSSARGGASVALVGCCLQKRRQAVRAPLCDSASFGDALHLPREALGLSNLTARARGVEASRVENLAARERRFALHRLLLADGEEVRFGAEIAGLNRRAAHLGLDALVARAFAVRGRPVPGPAAIREAERHARREHARARRLAIPRALLARVLEVFVLVDRALLLERSGMRVAIGTLFDESISARNLALAGSIAEE